MVETHSARTEFAYTVGVWDVSGMLEKYSERDTRTFRSDDADAGVDEVPAEDDRLQCHAAVSSLAKVERLTRDGLTKRKAKKLTMLLGVRK